MRGTQTDRPRGGYTDSVIYRDVTGGFDRLKKQAPAGVKRLTGPAGGMQHPTHIKEAKQDVRAPSC